MAHFTATFQSTNELTATFQNQADLSAAFGVKFEYNKYTGAYDIVPTNEAQVLETNGRLMTSDVIVEPIPSNYGLITWNGTILTVS